MFAFVDQVVEDNMQEFAMCCLSTGEVCVESVPSTPEAFMTFSVAYAKDW